MQLFSACVISLYCTFIIISQRVAQVERSGKASFNGAQVGCIKSLSADNEAAAGEQEPWKTLI